MNFTAGQLVTLCDNTLARIVEDLGGAALDVVTLDGRELMEMRHALTPADPRLAVWAEECAVGEPGPQIDADDAIQLGLAELDHNGIDGSWGSIIVWTSAFEAQAPSICDLLGVA